MSLVGLVLVFALVRIERGFGQDKCLCRLYIYNCPRPRSILTEPKTTQKRVVSGIMPENTKWLTLWRHCEYSNFYAPGSNDRGHIVIVLSFCLSVVNFNLRYNFWAVRGRNFIFGMHSLLMTPFQMTPMSMIFTLTLKPKIAFWTLLPPGDTLCFTNTPWFLTPIHRKIYILLYKIA